MVSPDLAVTAASLPEKYRRVAILISLEVIFIALGIIAYQGNFGTIPSSIGGADAVLGMSIGLLPTCLLIKWMVKECGKKIREDEEVDPSQWLAQHGIDSQQLDFTWLLPQQPVTRRQGVN